MGKQTRISFKSKNVVFTTRPLELLHMNLFGPSRIKSLGGNYYDFVIVDNYSRFCWTIFLASKSDTFSAFEKFTTMSQNKLNTSIVTIRSDHIGEFENHIFKQFCETNGIYHNFSAPRTPQQNGVLERKNRILEELGRTMINENNIPKYFWADAINTTCYVLNRILIRPILNKTPYELLKGRKPNVSHLHIFGCKCFVLNNGKENLGKFDSKADEGIFLGYSQSSKAYRVYNKRLLIVEESMHVSFDESYPKIVGEGIFIDGSSVPSENIIKDQEENNVELHPKKDEEESDHISEKKEEDHPINNNDLPLEWKSSKDHPIDNILGDI
jgi:hypothetical protein